MTRRLLAGATTLLALAGAADARADTPASIWERAKDPVAAEQDDLHVSVQRMLLTAAALDDESDRRGRHSPFTLRLPDSGGNALAIRQHAIAMLERAGAEKSTSALLRYDLANVLSQIGDNVRAAAIYKAAISEFPDHPATPQAWLRLGFACGHLGDSECERRAWTNVLRVETEEIARVTPTLNLAETQMHRGDLKEAIEGYREAFRLASRLPTTNRLDMGDTATLAVWGLAVAYDRAGDRGEAEKQAKLAVDLERSMNRIHTTLHNKGVFFEPDYEVRWYDGLEAMALARGATKPQEALLFWQASVAAFSDYVKRAEAKSDRWLPMAKVRLKLVQAERDRFLKNTKAAPVKAPAEDKDVEL